MDKIQQFFFDKWAIEERRYHQLLSILLPGLKNGNLASVEQYLGAKRIEAYAAVPYVADRWELDDASLPQGAVVVLTCEGVLYSWETYRLEEIYFRRDGQRPHIGCRSVCERARRYDYACGCPGKAYTAVPQTHSGLYHGRMRFGAFLVRFRMRTQIRLLAHG